ncbi:adenosylmethionine-8-amino-7-oxononanoate aminotransferase [Zhouia amylolytica]|uniref:Adenosylmethionine-8-amino-7-oxononanoate aminotransferase n=1 Tax=Zhouia amylolytica TaxID=376730 RepID=A0A1I6SHG1_9FLAO|nr:adenosylmethionine--8-amino-7-oxononanoate transaminase [Zhouia amylolytica]SFS76178.1 adenosylmethionine-8-amino-7-oxononanoate aminotransferase [Zhouia amylolytica]
MTLQERDKAHLWHPLTQHKVKPDALGITKAKGAYLYDEHGKEYIDGIASWYTCMYGHCNPFITEKVAQQMQTLDQVVFAGFTHEPAVKLSEALVSILPGNQQKLFFSENGSTAVDVAIKMAFQYHFNGGDKRDTLIAFEDGFHGDTFGAMSVSSLSVYNGPFEDFFLKVIRIPTPDGSNNADVVERLKQVIAENKVAAFVYEPLVQGAAAMKMYDLNGLQSLLACCKENDVLTIADEVMTGFGKTGKNFASEFLEIKPDFICMSKALTAGLLPMAITSCTQEIYDAFYDDDIAKGFFHGHTYTANPLACMAALAGIELLASEDVQGNIQMVVESHQEFDQEIKTHPKVAGTRQQGVIYALDLNIKMERYGNLRDMLFKHFMDQGVFLRPLGNTIYILAPYTITKKELEKIYDSIKSALDLVL